MATFTNRSKSTTTFGNQTKSGTGSNAFKLLIDSTHFLLIDSLNFFIITQNPTITTAWSNQVKN